MKIGKIIVWILIAVVAVLAVVISLTIWLAALPWTSSSSADLSEIRVDSAAD